jgi:N6-adenosine-specific RNA methylase IME4
MSAAIVKGWRAELAKAKDVRSVKQIHDKNEAVRVWLKKSRAHRDEQNQHAEIAIWSTWQLGRALQEMARQGQREKRGGDRRSKSTDSTLKPKSLKQLEISRDLSSMAQRIASLEEGQIEERIAEHKGEPECELHTGLILLMVRDREKAKKHKERLKKLGAIEEGDEPLEAPERFPILLADPPWQYDDNTTDPTRVIENQYPTMPIDALCALPVGDVVTDDAVLFMWATSPLLAKAVRLVAAWGFDYQTCMVWVKDKIGMGYFARQRHELLLIATKGKPPKPAPGDRPDSVIEAPRGEHSVKPVAAYEVIERMYPTLPRMEMFCRSPRDGWHVWGNQAK